jgi:alkanesulfonate monooxygenase SsuD/methylene tetrahydromethanopterin reductase-like flavin-dependent oxidoreductase (luciferase family)
MTDMRPLPITSNGGADVLYFDADASPTDLWECATWRLDAAQEMLEQISQYRQAVGADAMPAVATVVSILMSDAQGMLRRIGQGLIDDAVRRNELPADAT